MNDVELVFVAGVAKAKAKDVRAPKKRSILRPVVWSTKGVESCDAVEVASSPAWVGVERRHANRVTKRMS
jgi:hypothetical protein